MKQTNKQLDSVVSRLAPAVLDEIAKEEGFNNWVEFKSRFPSIAEGREFAVALSRQRAEERMAKEIKDLGFELRCLSEGKGYLKQASKEWKEGYRNALNDVKSRLKAGKE